MSVTNVIMTLSLQNTQKSFPSHWYYEKLKPKMKLLITKPKLS